MLQVPPPPPPRKIRSSPSVGQGDARWSNPSPSAPPGVVSPSDAKLDVGAVRGSAPGREPPPKAKLAEGWQRAQSEETAAEVTA